MRRHHLQKIAFIMFLVACWAWPSSARAQEWMLGGTATLSSGLEGGGGKAGLMRRAPTRLRVGVDAAVDEDPKNIFGAGLVLAMEPRAAFGADVRYSRSFQPLVFSAGAIGYLQPGSLVGPLACIEYRKNFGKLLTVTAGPELNVFAFGTDIPDKTVIWQVLVDVGVRFAL